MYVLQWVFKMF